ncbi:hypothetical protein NC653_041518 [Populus alba x Populus x berolinensis]|uniref:Uncharacterized protein n=1 Tax=Populus alba x Populus x berolinensis TaxID=444605 RepID=A0AAD6PQ22_9ROSI|nr:hypothetical protein NC653_041518 [Populus alba x Populus x berolinensis]
MILVVKCIFNLVNPIFIIAILQVEPVYLFLYIYFYKLYKSRVKIAQFNVLNKLHRALSLQVKVPRTTQFRELKFTSCSILSPPILHLRN